MTTLEPPFRRQDAIVETKGACGMRTMVPAAMVMVAMLAGPGSAATQSTRRAPERDPADRMDRGGKVLQDQAGGHESISQPASIAAPGRKQVRPGKTFGPDLFSFVAAPVGVIVAPINEGLHAFDAAMTPLKTVLLPVTGPLATVPDPASGGPVK